MHVCVCVHVCEYAYVSICAPALELKTSAAFISMCLKCLGERQVGYILKDRPQDQDRKKYKYTIFKGINHTSWHKSQVLPYVCDRIMHTVYKPHYVLQYKTLMKAWKTLMVLSLYFSDSDIGKHQHWTGIRAELWEAHIWTGSFGTVWHKSCEHSILLINLLCTLRDQCF